jgi:LacI family transcriptional regulator
MLSVTYPVEQSDAMSVTIHDIARELNLSAMTISRVLNRPEQSAVAPATRERVLKKAAEMGYRPNRYAKALVSRRPQIIAIWIDHLRSSVYSQIADACRDEIQRAGLQSEIFEMDWHFPEPGSTRRMEWMVDGILAVDPPGDMAGLFPDTVLERIPRVNLGSGLQVMWPGDYVRVDLQEGTRVAVGHLLGQGCRRIAYAVPAGIAKPGEGNFDAFAETVLAAGCVPDYIRLEDLRLPAVRQAVKEHIRTSGKPDGIFCHYDELAIAAFRALRDLGLAIPDDILLMGCEGNEFMEYFDPPISTIAMPAKELASVAWSLLRRRIEEPETPPQAIILPHQFHARRSSEAVRP